MTANGYIKDSPGLNSLGQEIIPTGAAIVNVRVVDTDGNGFWGQGIHNGGSIRTAYLLAFAEARWSARRLSYSERPAKALYPHKARKGR